MWATSSSEAVIPERTSTTKTMQSAVSMAIWACWRIWARMPSVALGSMPPVSTSSSSRPCHSQGAKIRSRVMPGVSSTMASRWPHNLLNRVDLPTLGRPTTATMGLLMACFLRFGLSAAGDVQPAAQQGAGLLAVVGGQDLHPDPQLPGQLFHRDAVQEHIPLAAQHQFRHAAHAAGQPAL